MERFVYPTVTSNMWHPIPEIRDRWIQKYGRDRFTFKEALEAQTFPKNWLFPSQKTVRWKWLAEAFPPKVSEYLFKKYVSGDKVVVLDLFAGIGGWGLGAFWAGKVDRLIMVEIDKMKCKYLKYNFSRLGIEFEVICEDVRSVDFSSLDIDVVTMSPPCEDLSKLKFFRRLGKDVGTIPLTVFGIELVEELRPRIAFYENVYRKILKELLEMNHWKVTKFDMSRIIPQKRVRLIAIKKFV